MNLTEAFAILKYGVNILLVGLGILSFEDISHEIKSEQQILFTEKVNYVERLENEELEMMTNGYYPDRGYFKNVNNYSDSPIFNKPINSTSDNSFSINDICLTDSDPFSEEFILVDSEYSNSFEIIIVQDKADIKNEFYILINEIEHKVGTNFNKDIFPLSISKSIN